MTKITCNMCEKVINDLPYDNTIATKNVIIRGNTFTVEIRKQDIHPMMTHVKHLHDAHYCEECKKKIHDTYFGVE